MKKVLSLVLALVLVLGSFSAVLAAPSDVVGTEYEAAVDRLIQLGALDGYPDGSFKPANTITRAEFAAAVVKVKGLKAAAEAAKGLATEFKDVPATHWASGYIGVANRLGLVNGMGDGTYAPESPITYEQAVTLVIRAIGYEPAAQARGAYPYGYLIVANENGLLDAVKGNQGLPASRGLVAQLLDNALEIPMMVQVGFGTQATWAVSGTQGTKVKLLLDDLGFDNVEGRVVSFDADRNRVTLNVEGKSKVLSVNEGFDFNYVEGLNIKAWFTGSKIVVYSVLDEAKLVATSVDGAKLRFDGKSYNIAKDAYLELNDSEKDEAFASEYAKVVLNDDNEVVWAKGYSLPEFLVIDELKDEVAYGYNGELKLKGFTLLKDGRTIELEDIDSEDILLFNKAQSFAIVYNNSKEGEIERVYSDEFKLGGKVYGNNESVAKFLDGNAFGNLDETVLADMMAEGKAVEVFFNTKGAVILVVGNRGKATTNTFYGLTTAKSIEFTSRSGKMWSFDVLTLDGKKSYDLKESFVIGSDKKVTGNWLESDNTGLNKGTPVKVTVNKDGVPTAVEILTSAALSAEFKLTASYVDTHKLQASTLVFYSNNEKVAKVEDIQNFTKVTEGRLVVNTTDRIVMVYDAKTNADSDSKTFTGLVTNVRTLKSGVIEFTFANGDVLLTESDAPKLEGTLTTEDYKKEIVSVKIGDKTGKLVAFDHDNDTNTAAVVAKIVSPKNTTEIVLAEDTVKLSERMIGAHELTSDAVIYDVSGTSVKTISLRDLKAGDKVDVYQDGQSTRFVNVVVKYFNAATGTGSGSGSTGKQYVYKGTYTLDGNTYVQLDDVSYPFVGSVPAGLVSNEKVTAVFTTIRGEVVVTSITEVPAN